ncbi:MAG: copper homeostasis protein CutC [Saprospiraceae bacterium]
MTLEVCAGNFQSALAAYTAGAHRIELCAALNEGGLTPSAGLIKSSIQAIKIPVNVLIRPRAGNFTYTSQEVDLMVEDILHAKALGANGVVIGALNSNRDLDHAALERLVEASTGMDRTFHRAFDFVQNPMQALDWLVAAGFNRVLSSGQSNSALLGKDMLKQMVEHTKGKLSIMPGAGINAENILELAQYTGASEFHFSARAWVRQEESGQRTIQGLDPGFWASAEENIIKIQQAIGQLP